MQPLLTQVPPNRLRSIIATFMPAPANRTASEGPAWPVPITIASYLVAMRESKKEEGKRKKSEAGHHKSDVRRRKIANRKSGGNSSGRFLSPLEPNQAGRHSPVVRLLCSAQKRRA